MLVLDITHAPQRLVFVPNQIDSSTRSPPPRDKNAVLCPPRPAAFLSRLHCGGHNENWPAGGVGARPVRTRLLTQRSRNCKRILRPCPPLHWRSPRWECLIHAVSCRFGQHRRSCRRSPTEMMEMLPSRVAWPGYSLFEACSKRQNDTASSFAATWSCPLQQRHEFPARPNLPIHLIRAIPESAMCR